MGEMFGLGIFVLIVGWIVIIVAVLVIAARLGAICAAGQENNKLLQKLLQSLRDGSAKKAPEAPPQPAVPKAVVPPPAVIEPVPEPEPLPQPPPAAPPSRPALQPAARQVESFQERAALTGAMAASRPIDRPQAAAARPAKPAAPKKPRLPSEFELRAREILRKIWSWIIVGEEFRPKDVATEYSVATVWLVRGSMMLLLFGIGFFIKFSHDNNLLPPLVRVLVGAAAGLAMIGVGCRLARKRYHLSGMGLIGAGVVTLYFAVFAGYIVYDKLIPALPAWLLLMAVTAAGALLALRYNALLIAVLASLGGYVTPFLIADGTVPEGLKLGYALVLGAGMLGLALFRNWKLLNLIAFAGTYVIYFHTRGSMNDAAAHFPLLITFLSLYFVLFSMQSIVYNIFHRIRISLFELLLLFANAALYLALALPLTIAWSGQRAAALVTLAVAVFYTLQIVLFLRFKVRDRNLLMTMLVLAVFALALTFPLLLNGEWITTAWALQALAMLFLGVRIKSGFLRSLAMLLYGVTVVRLFGWDVQSCFGADGAVYWTRFLGRLLSVGSIALSFAGGAWILKKSARTELGAGPLAAVDGSDFDAPARGEEIAGELFLWLSILALCVWGLFEAGRFAGHYYGSLGPLLRVAVLMGALTFVMSRYRARKFGAALNIAAALAFGIGIYVLIADILLGPLNFAFRGFSYVPLDGIPRLLQYLGLLLPLLLLARRYRVPHSDNERFVAAFFTVEGLLIWFIYSSLEVYNFFSWLVPGFGAGAVSVLWGFYAFGLVAWGIGRRSAPLRLTGLILFVVTAVKILLVDLSGLANWQRVIALVLIALAMLAGAFIYMRFRDLFSAESQTE